MKKIILIFIATIVVMLNTCSDNPVNPGDNVPPGRRDYVWTVDTIDIPFSTIRRLWGISPNDFWAIVSGSDLSRTIWHYDGNIWTTDGISRNLEPTAIFGFSSNNIWIGGSDGRIWYYDGNVWNEDTVLNVVPGKGIVFENIWGESRDNVYAVGAYTDDNLLFNNGVIAHYDGNAWSLVNIEPISNSLVKIYKDFYTNQYFLRSIKNSLQQDSTKILKFSGTNLTEIYGGTFSRENVANMELIGREVYFVTGREINKYNGSQFETISVVNEPNYANGIWGRNQKDLFLAMLDGVAHYNGKDVQYLFKFDQSTTHLTAGYVFDKVVFFSARNRIDGSTFIYKGELSQK